MIDNIDSLHEDSPLSGSKIDDLKDIDIYNLGDQGLSVAHINIRSLRKNFLDFVTYLHTRSVNFDILILTEIWIKQEEKFSYEIDGYTSYFDFRSSGRSGGVVMYLKNVKFNVIKKIDFEITSAEFICCYDVSRLLCISGIYRSHKYPIDYFCRDFENIISTLKFKNIYFIGDFNINILSSEPSVLNYNGMIATHGFQQGINIPTRVTQNTATCIDHVTFKNNNCTIINNFYVCDLPISDHFLTVASIKIDSNSKKESNEYTSCFNSVLCNSKRIFDENLFLQNIKKSLPPQLNEGDDLSIAYSLFNGFLNQNISNSSVDIMNSNNLNISNTTKEKKNHPWINQIIIELINKKETAYKKFKKFPYLKHIKEEYKNLRNLVTKTIRIEKKNYLTNCFEKCGNNTKKQWLLVNQILNSNKKLNDISNFPKLGSNKDLATKFNDFFTSVFESKFNNEIDNLVFNDIIPSCDSVLIPEITATEVKGVIDKLKNCAPGHDGINLDALKVFLNIYPNYLSDLINYSFSNGHFFKELKIAVVTPIFKAGDRQKIENYRPIASLSHMSKIIETILKDKLYSFLEKNNIFSQNQYGFRKGRGTGLLFMNYTKYVYDAINNNYKVGSFFMDIRKAFDTLNQDILIKKLQKVGVRGPLLDWCSSYIKNRFQYVKIKNCKSYFSTVNSGVPQGSVLSPIFFLIFINDLCNLKLPGKLFCFADDTAVVFIGENLEILKDNITEGINVLSQWFFLNKLEINVNKSKYIIFNIYGSINFNHTIQFHIPDCGKINCDCSAIEKVNQHKYLGITIEENLKWKSHIKQLCNKLNYVNFRLYYLKFIVNRNFLKKLYYAWIHSNINYSIALMGGNYSTNLQTLNNIYKRIYNVCFNSISRNTQSSVSHLNTDPPFMNLRQQFIYSILLFIFKNPNFFNQSEQNLNLRNAGYKLYVPIPHKQFIKNTHIYQGPKNFNLLPVEVRTETSLKIFKSKIREFVLH